MVLESIPRISDAESSRIRNLILCSFNVDGFQRPIERGFFYQEVVNHEKWQLIYSRLDLAPVVKPASVAVCDGVGFGVLFPRHPAHFKHEVKLLELGCHFGKEGH